MVHTGKNPDKLRRLTDFVSGGPGVPLLAAGVVGQLLASVAAVAASLVLTVVAAAAFSLAVYVVCGAGLRQLAWRAIVPRGASRL